MTAFFLWPAFARCSSIFVPDVSRNARLNSTAVVFGLCWCWCLVPFLALAQVSGTPEVLSKPDLLGARVVIVQDDQATLAFKVRPERVRQMLERGLTHLTGQPTPNRAWLSLVSTQDIVGLKVYSKPGPLAGTRPAVVAAAIEGLLAIGLPPSHIVIWDKNLLDLRAAGFGELARQYGVELTSSLSEGWDESRAYANSSILGQLVAGDLEFQRKGEGLGRKSFLSKLLTHRLTRIVNISPLLNNYAAGVAGNLYGLALGSVDNSLRFENDTGTLVSVVPEICALEELGDRVALNIVDALICQYEGEVELRLHYATSLNQLRLSKDPVALDVLSVDELTDLRRFRGLDISHYTNQMRIYRNASAVWIEVSDPARISLERVRP